MVVGEIFEGPNTVAEPTTDKDDKEYKNSPNDSG